MTSQNPVIRLTLPISGQKQRQRGSALAASLLAAFILTLLAGHVLLSITRRYETGYRSAAWRQSLLTAEAGLDMTVGEIARLLPDVRLNAQEGIGLGFSQPTLNLLTGLQITPTGLLTSDPLLSFTTPTIVHGGEGATESYATLHLDVLALNQVLGSLGLPLNQLPLLGGSNDLQLVRIRSQGTVILNGSRRAMPDFLDAKLRHTRLVFGPKGQKLTRPIVTREVEIILKPAFPFQKLIVSEGRFDAFGTGTEFDSFNSLSTLFSNGGLYDVTRRRQNGDVVSNSPIFNLGGKIYGDAGTNGGTLVKNDQITGRVNNAHYRPLPFVRPPTWNGNGGAPSSVTGNTKLNGGLTPLTPTRYKIDNVSGTLTLSAGLLNLFPHVEVYITGNVTGKIIVENGVHAKIYVGGSMTMGANSLQNLSKRAGNLQIYGVVNNEDSSPTIRVTAGPNLYAGIYAPGHHIELQGDGDMVGSMVGKAVKLTGNAHVHYDEGLALNVGPILGYEIVSWREIVP